MKILTIVGARPQFVKAATVSRVVAQTDGVDEILVHTGQHYDQNMSDVFFEEMRIPKPDYNLEVNNLSHGAMTGRMLEKIEELLLDEKPDWLLVYGDTNSTLAGALAASKLHIPLAHVEAGLRSFNMKMPEEVNRILTDRVSNILFCPTQQAITNLKQEGFDHYETKVSLVGDVMLDAARYYEALSADNQLLDRIGFAGKDYVLATFHRQENTDDIERISGIVGALEEINKHHPVVVPLHPRTRARFEKFGIKPSFTCIDPVGYFDMINLIKGSILVATDSGGLQKEAFFFGRPCITMREQTEWVELVEHGFNQLAGANKDTILEAFSTMKSKSLDFAKALYGEGKAAEKIVQELMAYEA